MAPRPAGWPERPASRSPGRWAAGPPRAGHARCPAPFALDLDARLDRPAGILPDTPSAAGWDTLTEVYAAVRPGADDAFALVLTETSAAAMQVVLDHFAAGLAPGIHAALLLDRAGWHTARAIAVPANVSLIHLPPYSPELNPVERIWLYLRERFLSHRLFADLGAVTDGCSDAWNRLRAEPGRIMALTDYRYLRSAGTS